MSETTRTPEATPGGHSAPDSLEAAAASFQDRLFSPPKGTKKTPGEDSPEPKGTPAPEDDAEPETTDETDEVSEDAEEPDAEATDDAPEQEETDAEPESEDEQPEEDTDEEPQTTVRKRKLKMPDGTEEEVSEDEAYQGYLRTKDYTRKTQQAAEARKKAEAAELTASESASRYAAQLEQVKTAMDRLVPKEPDWADLRKRVSPEDFANTLADWQAFKKQRDTVEVEQKKVADEQAADFGKKYESWRKSEVELLLASVPEWVDSEVGKREAGEMAKYGISIGFSQEEIDHAVDHRMLLMLRKAMLWDKAQTVGAGKVKPKITPKGKIKTAIPGGRKLAPKPVSEEKRVAESLRKNGSLDAAASVFSHMLTRGPKRPK